MKSLTVDQARTIFQILEEDAKVPKSSQEDFVQQVTEGKSVHFGGETDGTFYNDHLGVYVGCGRWTPNIQSQTEYMNRRIHALPLDAIARMGVIAREMFNQEPWFQVEWDPEIPMRQYVVMEIVLPSGFGPGSAVKLASEWHRRTFDVEDCENSPTLHFRYEDDSP